MPVTVTVSSNKYLRYYEKLRKLLLESIREYVILNESEGGGKYDASRIFRTAAKCSEWKCAGACSSGKCGIL